MKSKKTEVKTGTVPRRPVMAPEIRRYMIGANACFTRIADIVRDVEARYGKKIPPQNVERYDPYKAACRGLSPDEMTYFETTRAKYLADTSHIPIASQTVRLTRMEEHYQEAVAKGNKVLALAILEQAAKDSGGMFTNRRSHEMTGKNGAAIEVDYVDVTDFDREERDKLRDFLIRALPGPARQTPQGD